MEDKKEFLKSISNKISEFDNAIHNLKVSFQNIDEKKNRIFEDDLMSLEIEKNDIYERIKEYNDDTVSIADLENELLQYEKKMEAIISKYNF
jgi:chromosome segregation ATPase